jgi:hypothetical protein
VREEGSALRLICKPCLGVALFLLLLARIPERRRGEHSSASNAAAPELAICCGFLVLRVPCF